MARNAELNRDVALKFLKPERSRDADSRRRFLQEAEVTGRLEHPGVVPIYALGTDADGSPCYAMRFIRGETLQDAIDAFHAAEKAGRDPTERSLALRDLLDRFVSICSTMALRAQPGHPAPRPQAAERHAGQVRRDAGGRLGPGQAVRARRGGAVGGRGDADAQLGLREDGSDTPTVGVVGTPAYMSPEQAEARWDLVGPASDLFSLGGILYAILTGQAPYQGRKDRRGPGEGEAVRVPAAAAGQAGRAAGAGSDLPEGDGASAGGPVRDGAGPGGGRPAMAGG